jgi:hypothetical protein
MLWRWGEGIASVVTLCPPKDLKLADAGYCLTSTMSRGKSAGLKTGSATMPEAARGRMWKAQGIAAADTSLKRSATRDLLANKTSKVYEQ